MSVRQREGDLDPEGVSARPVLNQVVLEVLGDEDRGAKLIVNLRADRQVASAVPAGMDYAPKPVIRGLLVEIAVRIIKTISIVRRSSYSRHPRSRVMLALVLRQDLPESSDRAQLWWVFNTLMSLSPFADASSVSSQGR
jgi:hypothetical protein